MSNKLTLKEKLNPERRAYKTKEEEETRALEIYEDIESLNELQQRLEQARKRASLQSRQRDLEYVEQLENMTHNILNSLTMEPELLQGAIKQALGEGNMKAIKDLLIAFGITVDKREALLGYDESRRKQDKRMRLEVIWKNKDGEQAGVRIKQD